MATLRNQFTVNTTDGESLRLAEEARARDMSALRRGYEAGRIGTDLNTALGAEASALADSDAVAAQAAVERQNALRQRQGMYAPEVGQVEDIGGIGDAASWAATQVGQGVASMQDPVALAAIGQGVGTVAKAVPGLRGLAALAPAAGALGAFGVNQQQMKGEFYGNLKEDPIALGKMTPGQANTAANAYGVGAGALDTIVPGLAGRALGGAALRAGAKVPGVGMGTLRAMGIEGLTEVGQGELSRQSIGLLNPDRDTTGDASARLNEFAGGAVGGAPFGAAGAVADNAYAGTANAGEKVKDAAGSVVDLANDVADRYGVKDKIKVGKTKLGDVIDLGKQEGKDAWERFDEAGGVEGVATAVRDKVQKLRMSAEEASALSGVMPADMPPEQAGVWAQENDTKRAAIIVPKLAEMADAGDADAEALLTQLESDDPIAQGEAIDQGAQMLLRHNDYARTMNRVAEFTSGDTMRGLGRKLGAGAVVAGRMAGAAARGAANTAKAVAEGFSEGSESKKSLQGTAATTLDYDAWSAWRDKNHKDSASSKEPGSTHAVQNAALGRSRLQELRKAGQPKADPAKVEASKRRATLFAELMAAEAEVAAGERPRAHRVDENGMLDVPNYARSIGFEIAEMAGWADGKAGGTRSAGRMASFESLTGQIDDLAGDMVGVLDQRAGDVVQRLLAASEPSSKPFLEYLADRVDGWMANAAARGTEKRDLGTQMVALLPPEAQRELLAGSGAGASQLVDTVLQVARGRVTPIKRTALEKALGGAETLNQMLALVNPEAAQESQDTLVEDAPTAQDEGVTLTDDGDTDTEGGAAKAEDFETKQAERKVGRNSAPKMYTFYGEKAQSIRNSDASRRNERDPFAPTEQMSKEEILVARQRAAEAKLEGEKGEPVVAVKRPRLVRLGAEGSDVALTDKVKQLEKTLGVDQSPENFFRLAKEELQNALSNKVKVGDSTEALRGALDEFQKSEAKQKGTGDVAGLKQATAQGRNEGLVKGHAVAEAAKRRGELAALNRLEAAFKAGNEKAISIAQAATERFFDSRAGSYRVEPVSAMQVMDEMKMPQTRRLAIFRDYMLQEAARDKAGKAESFMKLAREAQLMLLDESDGTMDDSVPRTVSSTDRRARQSSADRSELQQLLENPTAPRSPEQRARAERAAALEAQLGAPEAPRPTARLDAGQRRKVNEALKRYFSGGMMVRAEQLSDRMPGQIATGELMDMVRSANKARATLSKVASDNKDNPTVVADAREEVESGLINFVQREGANLMGTKDTTLSIPTNSLVAWVRNNRRELKEDKGDAKLSDEKLFLQDLLDGISAITDSGMVKSLPWVNDKDGERQRFSGTKVPGNLALPNRKGWQYNTSKNERVAAKAGTDPTMPASEEDVAEDQSKREDFFTADPLEGAPDNVQYKTYEEPSSKAAGSTPYRRRTTYAVRNLNAMGEVSTKAEDANRDAEVEDLRNRSAKDDPNIGREVAMSALKLAQGRAESMLVRRGKGADAPLDLKETMKRIESRLSAAEAAPGSQTVQTGEKSPVVMHNGAHYAYPLAYALSTKNLNALYESGSLNAAQAAQLAKAQRRAATIISGVKVAAHRIELAKAFAGAKAMTMSEANRTLSTLSEGAAPTNAARGVAAGAPKAQTAPAGGRVDLGASGPYAAKDQTKSDKANKFIGRGSERSSTAKYARAWGDRANTGSYAANDVVFISVEGNRTGRLAPNFPEIRKAINAGATLITDDAQNRAREYNTGERAVAAFLTESGYQETSPGQWAPKGKRKLSLQGATAQNLDAKLSALLAERGIQVDKSAMEGVPIELRVSLLNRTIQADPTQPMAQDVARFVSWLTVGSEFFDKVAAGIAGTKLEADTLFKVNHDARQSMYSAPRKQREVVRQAVETLLSNGLYKQYAAEAPLADRVMRVVRDAVRHVMEALGGVKYKELQGAADQYIADLLAGRVKLERPRAKGAVLLDPYAAFKADTLAANIAFGLAESKGFALTGSLAYAAQGTVYRPPGAAIHDLDFTTSMSRQSAERHLERLFPQSEKIRSFGGLGEFVSTYVVPPKGHTIDRAEQDGGVITSFVVRDANGSVVGSYTHKDGVETSKGVKATIVDLIGDAREITQRMTIPTPFGDRSILISPVEHAMAQKLMYARDKDIRDFANFVPHGKFNKQTAGKYEGWKNDGHTTTDKQIADAKAYLDKVLGEQIRVEFQSIVGHSGEWIESDNLLLVSTLTNAGITNVARHEALHAFFSKFIKANPKARRILSTLTDDPRVMRRVRALLKDEPGALGQLADGEERLAYIYQFAMAGQLKLPSTPGTTLMAKIRKFLRRVFQMISDQERAADLLYAFEAGKFAEPSAGARAMAKTLDQGTWVKNGLKSMDAVSQRAAAMTTPANTILAMSASPTARRLATKFFTNPGEEKAGHGEPGYLNARNQQMRRYDNVFRGAIDQLDAQQMSELIEAMQQETPTDSVADPDVAEAKDRLHGVFERFHRYLTDEKGLGIGKIDENYFPVVWDPAKIVDGGFAEMLATKYSKEMESFAASYNSKLDADGTPITADAIPHMIVADLFEMDGVTEIPAPKRQDGVIRPWFASGERRVLAKFISPEDRAPFLEKDLVTTLSRYVRQGVRSAEYSSRFGREGKGLAADLAAVKVELQEVARRMALEGEFKDDKAQAKWASRQYRDVADAAGAMEGTLGHDISHTMRKVNSWGIVYQNVRLLPLALFSSFVDPLGLIARGGDAREAFQTFTNGIRDVARNWKDMISDMPPDRQKDHWEQLAEHAGVIDGAIFSHLLADEYGSVYLDGKTKRINELMFKANGMESWNRAMRVGATRSAVRFIERHAKAPEQHSRRWLAELGFEPRSVPLDEDGNLITDKIALMERNPDMTMQEAERVVGKVHTALVRWVEGAVLSPNAAQRPAWGSDPHYSMFWHLKQFAYSFHETLIKRAVNEAKHGNVMPLGVFAWYIPTMIAADVTKGLLVGGGELPNYMKGYDMGDWVLHGADRSGVFGVGHLAADAISNPVGMAGPAVEQIADLFTQPMENSLVRAMPVNSLYANAALQ